MIRPQFDSILFDLDGTLWDSTPAIAKAWSSVAKDFGFQEVTADQIREVCGLPFTQCVEVLFGKEATAWPHFAENLNQSERLAITNEGGRLYENVATGLQDLKEQMPLFLVSNCQDWYLKAFLRVPEMQNAFTDSLCFGQTNRPKAENIQHIIEKHGLKRPVYVGDTHWDQEAASYAGCRFFFASYGFGKRKVACPSFRSFGELVNYFLTAPSLFEVETRKLTQDEAPAAQEFYRSVGYRPGLSTTDLFFGAFHLGELVGLVRLARENGVYVLRGMQILPEFQFLGLGTRLIRLLEQELGDEPCYCLPHGWLDRFYSQIGFQTVQDTAEIPRFLMERWQEIRKQYPQIILMKRRSSGAHQ